MVCVIVLLVVFACNGKNKSSENENSISIDLKRGDVISCGPPGKEFGAVGFESSCTKKVEKDFDLAIAMLHSFEYNEAEKVFAKVIDNEPGCAMAYWGVAMANYHPLWEPPSQSELEKGAKAIAIAQSLQSTKGIDKDYVYALAQFYQDWKTLNHRTRSLNYERAMARMYGAYPSNDELAIFYALTLVATADPADKTYSNQIKAGNILTALYIREPDHPGIVHYIIHTYDNPELANLALPAARKYASIAPSSAHAQHMPAHIFIRLGLWDECIKSSIVSTESARCYAETAGMEGHWDEELHGMDYLMYAYLQKAETKLAKVQYDYLKTIQKVEPPNFKVAYAFASIPSRYFLENKMWEEAAHLEVYPKDFPWEKFPWQKAIFHFTRLLGSVHLGDIDSVKIELANLNSLYDTLTNQGESYKANQVLIQLKTGEAWMQMMEGKSRDARQLMSLAADMEDKTEKHPVTPGSVLPARELLGDMLLLMNKPKEALVAYEANLKKLPNRFNGLFGAAVAAEHLKDMDKAMSYYQQLTAMANVNVVSRYELEAARKFLAKHKSNLEGATQ